MIQPQCDEHDVAMQRDEPTCWWSCPVVDCGRSISDEDLAHLGDYGATEVRVT